MNCHLIHSEAIDSALQKAKQYRSLLEPELAISICLDIFAIEPDHQPTLVVYILALTDTFSQADANYADQEILDAINLLKSDYQQAYYKGILKEKKAHSLLTNSMSASFAYELLNSAIKQYNLAKDLSPQDNDDAILRHNSCVRTIKTRQLKPRQDPDDVHQVES